MHHSYIVRVYRHEEKNPRMLVGTVERVGEQGKAAFTNIDELWDLMNGAIGKKKGKEKGGEGGCKSRSEKQKIS